MATNITEKLEKLPSDVRIWLSCRFGSNPAFEGAGQGCSVVVGEVGQHSARSNVRILSVQWVVPPAGAPLAGYLLSQTEGKPVPLPQPLTLDPMFFAWTAPCATYVGAFVTTTAGTGYVENYFYVQAPAVSSFTSVTGAPWVGLMGNRNFLRFGAYPADGITISATVTCPQNVSGTIGMIQLANNQRFMTDTDGISWRSRLNSQTVLDVGPFPHWLFYQNEIVSIGSQQSGQIQITDAPALELGGPQRMVAVGDGDPIVPERYQTYLMFQSSSPTSIWVPLGVLTWTWEGYTELANGNWSPVQQPGNTVNPAGALQAAMPSWTSNTASGGWVQGM